MLCHPIACRVGLLVAIASLSAAAGRAEEVNLMDAKKPGLGWSFGNGPEFPGATGGIEVEKSTDPAGGAALKLTGDFTKGGAYVQAGRSLAKLEIQTLLMEVKSPTTGGLTLRLTDSTGQCHQFKFRFAQGEEWQRVSFPMKQFFDNMGKPDAVAGVAKYEYWGGPKDGKWHGPATGIYILTGLAKQQTTLWVRDVRATVGAAASLPTAQVAYREDFEDANVLPARWKTQGDVALTAEGAFQGKLSLTLRRTQEKIDQATDAVGPDFKVSPGQWQLGAACRSDLHSPDNSYNGTLALECLDSGGKTLERITVAELYGKGNWQAVQKRATLPAGASTARFRLQLNKAYGQFWLDDVSAAFPASVGQEERFIDRALFATQRTGNLFLPGDPPVFQLTVHALRPLAEDRRAVRFVLRDYWGCEQIEPRTASLEPAGQTKDKFLYKATLDLAKAPIEQGRYYEVHVEIAGGEAPFTDFTSFAYLDEAPARKYSWREVPFTSRNWDNRVGEYFELSDRLGIRVCGIWSRWEANAPYKVSAPRFELIGKYGMGALMGTVGNAIEYQRKGYEAYDEKALREGARNLVSEYGKQADLIVCLGNEPHGKGEKVLEDVRAYKAMYEGAKAADPNVLVLGTSVGPEEEYFKAGMGRYCDLYDFHTYNDVSDIRRVLARYQELFKTYGNPRPIWATELGLNSQGMTRRAVAGDLVRKFATFFACGGANASWFAIVYPDADGKIEGSSGQAHNVFFCRYRCYCPKLDAIAYYNMVNGICVKKFVEERLYGGVRAVLFRDAGGRCLQSLWNESGAKDVFVPLKGVAAVKLIRIDGGIAALDAGGEGLTLRVGEDPMLLLYADAAGALPQALGEPKATLQAPPSGVIKGGKVELAVALTGAAPGDVSVEAPPFWQVETRRAEPAGVARFTLSAPAQSAVREAPVRVNLKQGGRGAGELAFTIPVRGLLGAVLLPIPADANGRPGVRLLVRNNSPQPQEINWRLALVGAAPMKDGRFNTTALETPRAYFAQAADGTRTVPGKGEMQIDVPLAEADPLTVYRVRSTVIDPQGRLIETERYMGGFVGVPRADKPIRIDGKLDEEAWARSRVTDLNEARQVYLLGANKRPWKGPEDLSGRLRFLWDDRGLYVAMEVEDDVFANPKEDGALWNQDGLQFLIDPGRARDDKSGKYDYSAAVGRKGPQAWCHLAPAGVSTGEMKDILIQAQPTGKAGGRVYELLIPWSRLAPFQPGEGANLGLCVIINEDDGPGRASYMGWFGDLQSKQIDAVGDLILVK